MQIWSHPRNWFKITSNTFVFACWIDTKGNKDDAFIQHFDELTPIVFPMLRKQYKDKGKEEVLLINETR